MNRLLNVLRFQNWPIWSKLTVAFTIGTMIPILIIVGVFREDLSAFFENNLVSYVQEKGQLRQEIVSDNFDQATQTMNAFINDTLILQYLEFSSLSLSNEDYNTVPAFERQIRSRLIDSRLFDQVLVTTLDGRLIYGVQLRDSDSDSERLSQPFETGADLSLIPAFESAQIALTLGETVRMAVVGDLVPDVFISSVAYDNEGNPIVFVLSRINIPVVVHADLVDDNIFYDTYSYLTTYNAAVVSAEDDRSLAFASVPNIDFRDGLNNNNVIRTQIDGQTTIAHYGPIRGTDFVIVTETFVGTQLEPLRQLLNQRIFAFLSLTLIFGLGVALLTNNAITPFLGNLQDAMRSVIVGDYERPVANTNRGDEIGDTARTFSAMRDQVTDTLNDLRRGLDARVRDLQATQEVSRFAASQRDTQTLLDQVVELIVDLFPNIYHAQIFLTHEESGYAVLQASTGEAGEKLLARGHRLGIGSVSVIGQVTEEGRVVIARDIGSSDVHRPNEFLPDTRSELAIPLRMGERVIGALDVQSRLSNTFSEAQISLLQTLADQIAIGIENARLYEESTRQLQAISASNQQNTYQAWREYMGGRRVRQLEQRAGQPANEDPVELVAARAEALSVGKAIVSPLTAHNTYAVAVPIILRGQPLGTVEWEMPQDMMNGDTLVLAEDLVRRLAISLDNARLFQESRIAIDRERLVNSITTRLTAQTDVNEILQTAVREIGQALRVPGAHIQLYSGTNGNGNGNGNTNGHYDESDH